MTTSAPAMWVLGLLKQAGESGWAETPDSAIDQQVLVVARGPERIVFRHRFNGGHPLWMASEYPERLERSFVLEPFRFHPPQPPVSIGDVL